MPCYAVNKIKYSKQEVAFIKAYYGKIPNTQLLIQLNTMRVEPVKMSSLRHQLIRLKLKGGKLIHWTIEQIAYMVANYQIIGNIELAKKLNSLKLSKRKFNKKHIEKKMILLGLKRSEESLLFIKEKHKKAGHYPGRTHAKAEGTITIRIMAGIPHPHIKVGNYFVKQARIIYKAKFGEIPKGYMVHFLDLNTLNLKPENLVLKKVGDLTFTEKVKMLVIAKKNIEVLNRPAKEVETYVRPDIAKADQKIKVVINPKLTLYVRPGTDIEALRTKYNRPLTLQSL